MAQIFNITHDDGTLDEYDSLENATNLSAETAAAMADTAYGLQVLIDSTTATYALITFTQFTSAALRFRFYLDPNTLTIDDGDMFTILHMFQSDSSRVVLQLRYDSPNYRVRAGVRLDNDNWETTAYYNITDLPHYIEVLLQYATGPNDDNAELTLWVDGAQQENKTDLDIYDITKIDRARFGAPFQLDPNTEGTFYLDEFVLRDDDTEIGPVAAAPLGFASIF